MSLATGQKLTETLPAAEGGAARTMTLPPWVRTWCAGGAPPATRTVGDCRVTVARGGAASLVTVTAPAVTDLPPAEFERRCHAAYDTLRAALEALEHAEPVRFWNFLPSIHQRMDDRGDRYIVFNAGRFRSLTEWFGDRSTLRGRLPTASAVGHDGVDLVVHCLTLGDPCASIENPRQVSAWDYSERYGALPPCFARATVVTGPIDGSRSLLVGGTASIRGEETVHVGDLGRQLDETMANFRSLIDAADPGGTLRAFTHVRAYYPRRQDRPAIEAASRDAFGAGVELEMVRADLCRSDLMVEIEGLAALRQARGAA